MNEEINIDQTLRYIRDHAEPLAKAKATRIYLEQYRKSQKALLINECTEGTGQSKESYAYANPQYITLLENFRNAVEEEEKLKWMMIAAQAKIDVWRSQNANNRFIDKSHV